MEFLQAWFYENHMIVHPGKCHYLIIGKGITNKYIELSKKTLDTKFEQKLQGITIDKDFNF